MRLSNYKKIRKLHCAIKQYTNDQSESAYDFLFTNAKGSHSYSIKWGGGALLSAIEFIRISHIIIVLILITETTACV